MKGRARGPVHPRRGGARTVAVMLVTLARVAPAAAEPPAAVSVVADGAASSGRPLDTREVIVPVAGAERMRIDNPLGNVTVRAWPRNDAIHIIAEKQSLSADALGRLRVHFTAWAGGEISLETRVEMGGRERALPLAAQGSTWSSRCRPPGDRGQDVRGDLSALGG